MDLRCRKTLLHVWVIYIGFQFCDWSFCNFYNWSLWWYNSVAFSYNLWFFSIYLLCSKRSSDLITVWIILLASKTHSFGRGMILIILMTWKPIFNIPYFTQTFNYNLCVNSMKMYISRIIKFLGSVFGLYISKDIPSIAPSEDDIFFQHLTFASIRLWLVKI